jgi:23S rRNA (adenine2503-C2)-methyltransferase
MLHHFRTHSKVKSKIDDVVKYIVEDDFYGKNEVSVIRKKDKVILCLPTQTNCTMGCTFCHLKGTTRPSKSLSSHWMVLVVDYILAEEQLVGYYENLLISFMGAGEPLLNFTGLIGAFRDLKEKYPRIRFGVATMMPKKKPMELLTGWLLENLGKYPVKFHLSVHGIFNREAIVSSALSAQESISILQEYRAVTGNPIEYHYTLVDGVNDSEAELREFSSLVGGEKSNPLDTVKFLTLSETNGCKATKLSEDFVRGLFPNNIVEFYDPPGRDVGSSCGMFDVSIYNEPLPQVSPYAVF